MRRILTLGLIYLSLVTVAVAQLGAGGAPVLQSQYTIQDYALPGYQDTTGRTTESAALVGGQTTGIFVVLGQSLIANHGAADYNPGRALAQQVNVYNGTVYRIQDPVLGASGTVGGMVSRIADDLITAGVFQRVIFIPVAIGGTSVEEWNPPGLYNQRLRVAILRARQLGYPITAFMWDQGQANLGTSKAAYKTGVQGLIDVALGLQVSAPWFVAKDTMLTNVVDTTIQDAQTELWGTTYNGVSIYAGPDIDSLTGGTNRQVDGTHLTTTGYTSGSTLWTAAINAVF